MTLYIAHFLKIKKEKGTQIEGEGLGYLWKVAPEIVDADEEVAHYSRPHNYLIRDATLKYFAESELISNARVIW